ncbi:MAG TPA: hypothetical protein VIF37_01880 [Methylobacter sp.]
MNAEQTEQQSLYISQEKLLAFVRAMLGGTRGREDDEHPLPPGPWDPVIRIALERINVFGPHPEPWRAFNPGVPWRPVGSIFGPVSGKPVSWKVVLSSILAKHPELWDAVGGHSSGEEVALNPQPLPPRFAFLVALAQTVISRAELFQEIADAVPREGEQQGIIIVSEYIARFIDDCGTGFKPKWPFPGPPPPWFAHEFDGIDLVVMATQFEQAAKETFSRDLRQNLANASVKLAEVGLSKMQ